MADVQYKVLRSEDNIYAVIRKVDDGDTLVFERAGPNGWEAIDALAGSWREAEHVDLADAQRLVKEMGFDWE